MPLMTTMTMIAMMILLHNDDVDDNDDDVVYGNDFDVNDNAYDES